MKKITKPNQVIDFLKRSPVEIFSTDKATTSDKFKIQQFIKNQQNLIIIKVQ